MAEGQNKMGEVAPGIDYELVAAAARQYPSRFQEIAVSELLRMWKEAYEGTFRNADLITVRDANVNFLFDMGSEDPLYPPARTVAAFGMVEHPTAARDVIYQAGFPTKTVGRLTFDRGHMMPYTGGGQFGPNIFLQDRALNRGWSAQGRRYRALEIKAVNTPKATLFCHLTYRDDTDVPMLIDLGYLSASDLVVDTFVNRTDIAIEEAFMDAEISVSKLTALVDTLTRSQFGDVGEETARAYLEDIGATIITLGDSRLPRDASRQDLDIVALVDGELIAFEVKTTLFSKNAGKRTKEGNLYRPRLSRSRNRNNLASSFKQGSFDYAKQRLEGTISVDGMVETRVIAVDLRALKLQQFLLTSEGKILRICSPVEDCEEFVLHGVSQILEHRGHL